MVRRVRFSSDDPAHFDPRDRRDTFDDLDDLVIDTVAGPEAPPESDKGSSHPNPPPSKRRNTKDDRRHLADADWLTGPKSDE